MNVNQKAKGFTIIEVVLVLAIAGLIFMMVFIALPALQRSQRDSARKSDVGIVASGISSYTGNNRGKFPETPGLASYVENVSENTTPGGITVNTATGAQTRTVADGDILVTQKTTCGDSSELGEQELLAGTIRQYTVVTRLESGNSAAFCQGS